MIDLISILLDGVALIISISVSAVAGFLARELLPNHTKETISYYMKKVRMWYKNKKYNITIYKKVEIDEGPEREETMSQISNSLGESQSKNNIIEFEKEEGKGKIKVRVEPIESTDTTGSHHPINYTQIRAVMIQIESEPTYRRLQDVLLDIHDIESEVLSSIPFKNSQMGSTAKCELPGSPTAREIFRGGSFTHISVEINNGNELRLSGKELEINANKSSSLLSLLKNAIIHYG